MKSRSSFASLRRPALTFAVVVVLGLAWTTYIGQCVNRRSSLVLGENFFGGVSKDFGPNVVFLIRDGKSVGAFYIASTREPEIAYSWCLRNEGEAGSDAICGSNKGGPIKFGPFKVSWSGSMLGRYYLYYPSADSSNSQGAPDVEIAVTKLDISDLKSSLTWSDDKAVFRSRNQVPASCP